jgi:outer membrane protein TolC
MGMPPLTLEKKLYLTCALTFGAFGACVPRAAAADLTLDEAIARALANAPKVRQAAAELQSAVESRRSAWADIGPRVTADYNEAHFNDEQAAELGGQKIIIRPQVSKTATLTAAQPVTGAFALAVRANLNGVTEDIKELALKQAQSDTAFGAAEAWLRAAEKARLVAVAEESILAAEGQSRDADALERAGRMNHGDTLKLDLAVSEAKARAAAARAQQEIALAQLRETVGLQPNEPVSLPDATESVKVDPNPTPPVDLKKAMERRLEPKQAELGVEATAYGKKVAYAQFIPNVNVFIKWDRNVGDNPAGLTGVPSRDTRTYGITADWLLWDNGSRVFQVRQAAEETAKAEAQKDGLLQGLRLELAAAESLLKAARESLLLAEVSVTQAEEAYRIEQARFKTGSRSATDLVLAEASRSGAQGRLVSARTDYRVMLIRMQKALGEERPTAN